MAALSRRRGSTSPAAHVKIEKGERPYESGQLLSVVPYRNKFAFVVKRAGSSDYSVKEVTFPDSDAKRASSWLEEPILERLRSAVRRSVDSENYRKPAEAAGLTPASSSSEDLIGLMHSDIALWRDLAKRGIRLQN